ncbi:MAG: bacteriohemerythrin [bacterium]|nr:bacteriohemerythrin [bacterium]
METLEWQDSYSVGHSIIDEQHYNMVVYANQLLVCLQSDKEKVSTLQALEFLVEETVLHFQTEEEYMHRSGFSGYVTHKIEHEKLVAQIKNLKRDCELDRIKARDQLVAIVRYWLLEHVLSHDKGLGRFLKSR